MHSKVAEIKLLIDWLIDFNDIEISWFSRDNTECWHHQDENWKLSFGNKTVVIISRKKWEKLWILISLWTESGPGSRGCSRIYVKNHSDMT